MTLRVYLTDTSGSTGFIDYGLDSKNYSTIVKVEIREDKSTVKTWWDPTDVKFPKTDNSKSKKKNSKTNSYEIFDQKIHNTETEFYWISAICSNCNHSSQIAIPKGEALQYKKLYKTFCPKCGLLKTLHRAKWDGHQYKVVKK